MTTRLVKLMFLAPLIVVGVALFITLGGVIVLLLWNWLLPPLFGWPQITFWQALALLALCRILFGGFGIHGARGSRIRARMAERWKDMPPEKRERIRQRMRERFGFDEPTGESREP